MLYRNMLSPLNCNSCQNRNICFLRKIPLENYPERTQNFVIHLPKGSFTFNNIVRRWYANYEIILNSIISHYNAECDVISENKKYPLSIEAQKESDRQFIRDNFKHLLEIAAKATEDSAPGSSIVFDGIGLILASDYIEAVHKILSMLHTYSKAIYANETACSHYLEGV